MSLTNTINAAVKTIKAFNSDFGYEAGKGEIAADVWHNHLSVEQRMEVAKGLNLSGCGVNEVRKCYAAVEALI